MQQTLKRRLAAVGATTVGLALIGGLAPVSAPAAPAPEPSVLRVYSNNIEDLVMNRASNDCIAVTGTEHMNSLFVDDNGVKGSPAPPDLLIYQQLTSLTQAEAYASQLDTRFGLPAGTYQALVAWTLPEDWGGTHHCDLAEDAALAEKKQTQTNGIIWNSSKLTRTATSAYWSAGWLKPGTAYNNAAGCTLYKSGSGGTFDDGATNAAKWKRTSAIAAKFSIVGSSTTVFAATMHLPEQNNDPAGACGGAGTAGIGGSGITFGGTAQSLMDSSSIKVVGIDANRTGITSALSGAGYGMQSVGGTAATAIPISTPVGSYSATSKIDYLFVNRTPIRSGTVAATKSNHLGLYALISY